MDHLSVKGVKFSSRDIDAINLKMVGWTTEGAILLLMLDPLKPADLLTKSWFNVPEKISAR